MLCLATAAAAVFFIFITTDSNNNTSAEFAIAKQVSTEYFEITNIEHFSTLPETYSLMSELPSPLMPEQELQIPEARITPAEQPEEPLLITELNRAKEITDSRPLEYYCTLKLTN